MIRGSGLRRLAVGLFAICAALAVAPAVSATPAPRKLDANLTALWTTVLETPSAQNSFGSGGEAFGCWNLAGSVAPFVSSTRSASMIALITNALPVSRWHQVQWQQLTNIGADASRYRTPPHAQPPST